MKQEIKERWVQALRSGEYEQGRGSLHTLGRSGAPDRYCCMGVLCDLAVKDGVDLTLGVEPFSHESGQWRATYDSRGGYPSARVAEWAGLAISDSGNVNPWVSVNFGVEGGEPVWRDVGLADLNDQGASFEQIADLIEANL